MADKILIVDDSGSDRLIIKKMLSDYDVITACDGVEAIEKIDENLDIDIIILDLNMPRMNGFEVLKILKSDEKYSHIRTIILTNYDELDKEIKGLNSGAVDFIRKPINLESLRIRIKIHLELIKTQNLLEKELNKKNVLVDTIFDQAPIGITLEFGCGPIDGGDKSKPIINKSFETITGRTREELIKLGWANITHPSDLDEDLENYTRFLKGEIESYNMEKRYVKPDGSSVWVDMTVAPIAVENSFKQNHICLVQDITKRKEQEIKLKYMGEHDPLTGLYNRRCFEDFLEKEKFFGDDSKKAAVFLNVKNINFINSSYGYDFSEKIIKTFSDTLISMSDETKILFQISFERFIFYVKNYENSDELSMFCEDLLDEIKAVQIFHIVGCDIGVLEITDRNISAECVLRKTHIAADGTDDHQYFSYRFFDKELNDKMLRSIAVKEELLKALYDNEEFLYAQYQPVLDLKTKKIRGFEALARIKSDILGIIPPSDFIPIAEDMQLIASVGKRITKMSCMFLKRLESEGYPDVNVYINVSLPELLNAEFVSEFIGIVEDAKVDFKNIGLEITETIFSSNNETINRKLEELEALGVRISIDDFGIGQSTFSREINLQVNCLKIDKSFIDRLMYLKKEEAITGDIISMAHRLGHIVVAEGVEHQQQMDYLIDHNCDFMQGFLFSRPLDFEKAIEFLKGISS